MCVGVQSRVCVHCVVCVRGGELDLSLCPLVRTVYCRGLPAFGFCFLLSSLLRKENPLELVFTGVCVPQYHHRFFLCLAARRVWIDHLPTHANLSYMHAARLFGVCVVGL